MSLTGALTLTAAVATAVVTLSMGSAWLFARLYAKPRRRPLTDTPADYGLPFRPVAFTSGGARVHGWFIPVDGASTRRPAVILAHGWSSNATQMLLVARRLHHAGFGVLLYDPRGHGASGGNGPITIRTFAEDLIAAVDSLEGQPGVDSSRVGVIGHSMGGASAILAASAEPRIRALVSCSAFADPAALTRDFMRTLRLPRGPFLWLVRRFIERWLGTSMADVSPQNRIQQIRVPLLLCHGASDRFVPPSNMDTLYARARPEQTQGWLVPGRRHWDVMLDSEYGTRAIEFLSTHLSFGDPGTRAVNRSCSSSAQWGREIVKSEEEELESLPQEALMGLGCGDPVRLADLRERETVVDLGSGENVEFRQGLIEAMPREGGTVAGRRNERWKRALRWITRSS